MQYNNIINQKEGDSIKSSCNKCRGIRGGGTQKYLRVHIYLGTQRQQNVDIIDLLFLM